jgi:hypothetical protein
MKAADLNDILRTNGEDTLRGRHDDAWRQAQNAKLSLLNDVYAFLGRFVVYPSKHAHIAHTLWIVHAHLMDAWDSTPRIAFVSPEWGSGKTRALETTGVLVPRPIESVNASSAYLFRKAMDPQGLPTILFDEIDTVFGPKAKANEEVRGFLNAGHRRGATSGRCIITKTGVETIDMPAYCAVALAGIGDIPDTLRSRSILIKMHRRTPHEKVEEFRRRIVEPEGKALYERIAAWADEVREEMAAARPAIPPGVQDRDADMWEPLLAIADKAGGRWPEVARVAAVALVALSKEDTPSLGLTLLSDMRKVFGDEDARSTEFILNALYNLPEAPWSDLRGKPLKDRGLASLLKKYQIKSRTVRIGSTTPRGYRREDFLDAWARYLGGYPQGSATSATSATTSATGAMANGHLLGVSLGGLPQ